MRGFLVFLSVMCLSFSVFADTTPVPSQLVLNAFVQYAAAPAPGVERRSPEAIAYFKKLPSYQALAEISGTVTADAFLQDLAEELPLNDLFKKYSDATECARLQSMLASQVHDETERLSLIENELAAQKRGLKNEDVKLKRRLLELSAAFNVQRRLRPLTSGSERMMAPATVAPSRAGSGAGNGGPR